MRGRGVEGAGSPVPSLCTQRGAVAQPPGQHHPHPPPVPPNSTFTPKSHLYPKPPKPHLQPPRPPNPIFTPTPPTFTPQHPNPTLTSSLFTFQPFCDGAHKKAAPGISPLRFTPEKDGTAWLCGCKRTRSPPYCDGTHKEEAVQGARLPPQP